MRWRRAMPIGASKGFMSDWMSSGSVEDGLRENKRRAENCREQLFEELVIMHGPCNPGTEAAHPE
jgi:hypothetical protein